MDANGFFLGHVANGKADMRQNEVPSQDFRDIGQVYGLLYATKVHLGRTEGGVVRLRC